MLIQWVVYVGESASLSYLQLIRMIVETVSGPSEFTLDPQRHNILENTIQLPYEIKPTGVLPDKKTADILVDSFFTNTSGLIDVFIQKEFLRSLDECYKEPLSTTQPQLCLLNLVFAIGLAIARPIRGTDEAAIIRSLHSEPISRAELFYRNAENIYNPVSGFEDADFWSIQALLLMSLYKLVVSKRNASYFYYGMAVRSAFAMGLHREDSMVIFSPSERRVRTNVWRTLFVLDRFLAACLGRPISILEDDCSAHALEAPTEIGTEEPMMDDVQAINSLALDSAVKSCYWIGSTLKKVYSKRKVSTFVAQEIADQLENWEGELHQSLHCRRIKDGPIDLAQAVAILHVNLLHCHSVLLLTRPFFLYLIKMGCEDMSRSAHKTAHISPRLEKFSQICVEASQRTIIIARSALEAEYLPQCNPFVIYFVFAAALIILSNEFASLYHNPDAENSIHSALLILAYCGERDAQAQRVSYIIDSFRTANMNQSSTMRKIYLPGRTVPTISTLSHKFPHEPMSPFFRHVKAERQDMFVNEMSPVKDRQVANMSSVHSEPTMSRMMPPPLQQPSPEGSVTLNSGIAATLPPSMEPLSGNDNDFDLDILWHGWTPQPVSSMGIPSTLHPAESFNAYGIHHPPMPQGNGLNPHVPSYPPSEYR
ncbi:fungal-specific transcription factor domain-containing protein [Annulohypoxylon maeteangense]|uniref:fungal-specific transcription factor domain-containing protein n=1 Tax=Annulohypoxylon maeteangense TaxID=1927788 RepID=UPI002007FD1E|nr:fungal-specific transcription factor domain-containing protein [Annulohypoxylon maeteangense]KAI0887368.1 fungal-specific transcription factor domain-containing protein [Annulohypoxylon maeteangense]